MIRRLLEILKIIKRKNPLNIEHEFIGKVVKVSNNGLGCIVEDMITGKFHVYNSFDDPHDFYQGEVISISEVEIDGFGKVRTKYEGKKSRVVEMSE